MTEDELLAFAAEHRLPIPPLEMPVDANLWDRCTRSPLADAAPAAPGRASHAVPDAADVVLQFVRGTPVGLNGVSMPLLEILSSLDTIAGAAGIGRTQRLVRRLDGSLVSQQCDAPAAMVLDVALRQLQRLVLPADAIHDAQRLASLYRDILARGAWAGASRLGCDAFVDAIQQHVSGTVRVRLVHGSLSVIDCTVANESADVAQFSR
jgi:argininosuccinate synthase